MNVVSSELGTYNGALETYFYITGLKTMNRDPAKLFFYPACLWCLSAILPSNWSIIIRPSERKIIKGFTILQEIYNATFN